MMRRSLSVACVFATSLIVGHCFILQDTSVARSDHEEIVYLKSVVNGLVNLTDAIKRELGSKNDLTQFLQDDNVKLNQTLQVEMQQHAVLDQRVRDLETKLRTLTGTSGENVDDITNLQRQMASLHKDLTGTKLQNSQLNQTIQNQLLNLTTNISSLSQALSALKTDSTSTPTIGFRATDLTQPSVSFGDVLVFPTIEFNTGNGYNSSTGVFTAPITGLYFLTIQACPTDRNIFQAKITVDERVVGWSSAGDHDWSVCAPANAVTHMDAGAKASIIATGGWTMFGIYSQKMSFSGALLNKDN